MKVTDVNGLAQVTMTYEELGIIRYALAEGVDKLTSAALFQKSMKYDSAPSAKDTADRATAASEELERAVQEWCRTDSEVSRWPESST